MICPCPSPSLLPAAIHAKRSTSQRPQRPLPSELRSHPTAIDLFSLASSACRFRPPRTHTSNLPVSCLCWQLSGAVRGSGQRGRQQRLRTMEIVLKQTCFLTILFHGAPIVPAAGMRHVLRHVLRHGCLACLASSAVLVVACVCLACTIPRTRKTTASEK